LKHLIPFLVGFLVLPASVALGALSEADKANFPVTNRGLINPGAELGKVGWSVSTGSFSIDTTNKSKGNASFAWNASAASQTFTSSAVTIPDGLKGQNGVLSCRIKAASGTATHTLAPYDGTNNLATAQTITSSTSMFQRTSVNFIFPTSGTIAARFTSAADEPSINIDECYLDLAEGYNISQVSQATVVASARWAATTSCDWSTTSTSFSNFGADSDCPSPTVEGNASAPSTKIPGLTFATLPEGDYYIVAKGAFLKYNLDQYVWFRFSDGTNATTEQQIYVSGAIYAISPNIVGRLKLTSPQSNVTLQIQAKVQTSVAAHIDVGPVAGSPLEITVYRFPLSSEIAYRADASAYLWSGVHDNTCDFTTTSSSNISQMTGDSSCGFTSGTGSNGYINVNAGTVVSQTISSNNGPGIVWTPNTLGKYKVCATYSSYNTTSGASITTQLVSKKNSTGSTILQYGGAQSIRAAATTDGFEPNYQCLMLDVTNIEQYTAEVYAGVGSNTGHVGVHGWTNAPAIYWTIEKIGQSTPAPVIVNSVTSNSAGAERIERASINDTGTCSIVSQSGSWVSSATVNGTGRCDLVITGFSSRPSCTCTVTNAGTASRTCHINGTPTSTSVSPYTLNAGTASSENFDIICMGPR